MTDTKERISQFDSHIPWAKEMEPQFEKLGKTARVGYSLYIIIDGEKVFLAQTEGEILPPKKEEPKDKASGKKQEPKDKAPDKKEEPKDKSSVKKEEPSKPKRLGDEQENHSSNPANESEKDPSPC